MTSTAWSNCPASASENSSSSCRSWYSSAWSGSVRAPSPSRVTACSSTAIADPGAPPASARRPASRYNAAAAHFSPAASRSEATRLHSSPGRSGFSAVTASAARADSATRSAGLSRVSRASAVSGWRKAYQSSPRSSGASSWAATADCRCPNSWWSSRSLTSCSTDSGKRRPSTAAIDSSRSPREPSRSARWVMACTRVVGTPARLWPVNRQPSRVSTSSPALTTLCSSSSTISGFPALSANSRSATASGTRSSVVPRPEATTWRTPGRSRLRSGSRIASPPRAAECARSSAGEGSVRTVTSTTTGCASTLPTRYSTTARVSTSASGRSSSTNRQPRPAPASAASRRVASASTTSELSPALSPSSAQSGMSLPSTDRYGPSPRTRPPSPVRASDSSASVSARNGTAGPVVLPRPRSTTMPSSSARPTASAASLVLPIPGSPMRKIAVPAEFRARCRAWTISSSSEPRPISAGARVRMPRA